MCGIVDATFHGAQVLIRYNLNQVSASIFSRISIFYSVVRRICDMHPSCVLSCERMTSSINQTNFVDFYHNIDTRH